MNDLIRLIEEFPDKPWDWGKLSANPNISLEYIESHPEFPWVEFTGSMWEGILANPNITMSYILNKTINKWDIISYNPGISLYDIESHLDLPWCWGYIGQNKNINMNFILQHIDKFKGESLLLGGTPNISIQDIEKYPDLFPNKWLISQNPNITLDYAFHNYQQNIYSPNTWSWYSIARRIPNSIEDIEANYSILFENPHFMDGLSHNPNITMKIIRENLKYDWHWGNICENPSITIEDIESIENYERHINAIMNNPNITYEWVVQNLDKINWRFLSGNKFKCHEHFDEPIIIRI